MPLSYPSHRRRVLHTKRHHSSSVRHATLVASSALLLLIVAAFAAVGARSGAAIAYAAPYDTTTPSPSGTDTTTPSATSTPATPPTIALVSPQSGQGPVGANLTITGSNFTAGGNVSIFASAAGDCSQQTAVVAATTATSGGSISTTFIWPISLNGGTFYICSSGITSGAPAYKVLAATPPTLSLSAPTIAAGQALTISGSGFVGLADGSQVLLAEIDSAGHATTFANVLVGSDGNFTTPWTVTSTTGTVTIRAESTQENGATPVLKATAQLVVTAAGSPTASVTVTATPGAGGGSIGNTRQSSGSGVVVAVILIIALVLLAGLGVIAFLLLRGRSGPDEAMYGNGGYGPGEYPGYSERNRDTAKVPGIGQTGRQPATGQFGTMGQFGSGAGRSDPRIGGVAQWDEGDPVPGPDWQPRPMSGRPREYDLQGYAGGYGETNPDGSALRQESYPPLDSSPIDPWASQGGAIQGRPSFTQQPPRGGGQGNRPQQRFAEDSNGDWWGTTTNPANDEQ